MKALLALGKVAFDPQIEKGKQWAKENPEKAAFLVGLSLQALALGIYDEIGGTLDLDFDITSNIEVGISISGHVDSNFHSEDLGGMVSVTFHF